MKKIFLISVITFLFHFVLLDGKKDLFDETQFKYLKRYEELSKLEIGTIISGGILVEPNEAFPIPTIEKR